MTSSANQRECNDDVHLLQASTGLLSHLKTHLDKVLWKRGQFRTKVPIRSVGSVIEAIEPFQEDPQLLDKTLKYALPHLAEGLAKAVELGDEPVGLADETWYHSREAVCRIIYTLCKVRGEKVVTPFFRNEPRYIEKLIDILEWHQCPPVGPQSGEIDTAEQKETKTLDWQEHFVLLLWLDHLMLTPFDLATISSDSPVSQPVLEDLNIPDGLPPLVLRILPLVFRHLRSSGKERDAAVGVLTRLVLRPDMRRAKLYSSVVDWILKFLKVPPTDNVGIHRSIGVLMVLKKLSASSAAVDLSPHLFQLFESCQTIMNDPVLDSLGHSGSGSRLCVKIVRHLAVHCIRNADQFEPDPATSLVETSIESLMAALSSSETKVRFAASKAVSHLVLALEPEMAGDVIEAIVEAYQDNLLYDGDSINMAAVNAQQWNGLTLTLAHLVHQRAPPAALVPSIINCLLLALNFEQRSATGSVTGTNVRDAACFGIWSIARRYRTTELLELDPAEIKQTSQRQRDRKLSVFQTLACELVTAACLDPVGNIRRGSSAALQELVGRHPNKVVDGISLVQVVDFHSVGLYERAAIQISKTAGQLDPSYWNSLHDGLLGWRGVLSSEEKSRVAAAAALSGLLDEKPSDVVASVVDNIVGLVQSLKKRQVEERHGLVLAAAQIIRNQFQRSAEDGNVSWILTCGRMVEDLALEDEDFTSNILRPHLTTRSIISIVEALATVLAANGLAAANYGLVKHLQGLFNYPLRRLDPQLYSQLPSAACAICRCLSLVDLKAQVREWSDNVQVVSETCPAPYYLATGSVFQILSHRPSAGSLADAANSGVDESVSASEPVGDEPLAVYLDKDEVYILVSRLLKHTLAPNDIGNRAVALRALAFTLPYLCHPSEWTETIGRFSSLMISSLVSSLNDYTVSERGDVGSIIRFEGLKLLQFFWTGGDRFLSYLIEQDDGMAQSVELLLSANVRLSLERLDKGRVQASECLFAVSQSCRLESVRSTATIYKSAVPTDTVIDLAFIASPDYFFALLSLITADVPHVVHLAVLQGISNATGLGTEELVKASREAIIRFLSNHQNIDPDESAVVDRQSRVFGLLVESIRAERSKTTTGYKWNDRVASPLVDLLTFLFDMKLTPQLSLKSTRSRSDSSPSLPTFSGLVAMLQTFHFRSQGILKLLVSVSAYRSLAICWPTTLFDSQPEMNSIESKSAISRLASFLLHSFPRVREEAAESLWLVFLTRPEFDIPNTQSNQMEICKIKEILIFTDWKSQLDDDISAWRNKYKPAGSKSELELDLALSSDRLPTSITVRQAGQMVIDMMSRCG